MSLDNILLIPGLGGTTASPLLDVYPTAYVALGFRKLRTAYSGQCCRVRRASDNAEQDIGFSGGARDDSALSSFCAGTDGFLVTWYDQSGNGYNATQSTLSAQAQVVSSGTPTVDDTGNPSTVWDGSAKSLEFSVAMPSDTFFYYLALSLNAGGTSPGVFGNQVATSTFLGGIQNRSDSTGTEFQLQLRNAADTGSATTTETVTVSTTFIGQCWSDSADSARMAVNNLTEKVAAGRTQFDPTFTLRISTGTVAGRYLNDNFSELVIWGLAQGSNRTGILSNVNGYFGVY